MFVGSIFVFHCAGVGTPLDKKRSFTRLELAKDYLRKGEYEAGHQEAMAALKYDPNYEEAYNVLGLVEYFRALDNFRLMEIRDCLTGVDAEVLQQEFESYLSKADGYFSKAIQLSKDYAEARSNQGAVALQLGDYHTAIRSFSDALGHPARLENIAVTRANLGWAYFQQGEYVRAAKELRQSLQFHQQMCVASYRLGRVYFARKEWEKALERLNQVSLGNCLIQEVYLYKMKTLIKLNRTSTLQKEKKACEALAPQSCVAAQCRALVRNGVRQDAR